MKFTSFLVLAALIAMPQMLFVSCSSSSQNVDNVDLVAVRTSKDGNWSMINSKGEIVYDSEFKNSPTAAYNGLFSVKEGKGLSVYKIGGKSLEIVGELEGLYDAGYLEDGLMPVTFPGKRICVVDADGKTKFELNPLKGSEIVRCAPGYVDGLLLIMTEDGKYGYIDKLGNAVIQPLYEDANLFAEGLAVVAKSKDEKNGKLNYVVIDTKGTERFKIKEGYDLKSPMFQNGFLVAEKDDRMYLINTKGEETKLSAKIHKIYDYNEKYIIFRGDEGDYGVANFEDEILIRPKYSSIEFSNEDFFLAKKDGGDDELIKLSTDGEDLGRIDYEDIKAFGTFGYFAKEGKTIVLLDDNFNKKCNEEFFNINTSWDRGMVFTDYFNADEVASAMVKMIDGNKVGSLQLGVSPAQIFKGKSPEDYTYKSSVDFDELTKKGFRYEIKVQASFSGNIADYDYDYYSYNRNYYWNPSAKLSSIVIAMTAESDWGKKGQKALEEALAASGYKMLKEGKYGDSYAVAFKKNNIVILAISEIDGKAGGLVVFDVSDTDQEKLLLSYIEPLDGSEESVDNTTQEYGDYDENADTTVADYAVPEEIVETTAAVEAEVAE